MEQQFFHVAVHIFQGNHSEKPDGVLYRETTEVVSAAVITTGQKLRAEVSKRFTNGPNGKHFIETVLFRCLLPTVGFHVLSRTGHTDLIDSFWLKHTSILHSSTHLKYQELYLYYSFFKCIIPSVVLKEMYLSKPGRVVTKLLSFTGSGKQAVDRRGFSYVHRDEALEMMIVRHLKSLSRNIIGHLESSAAWLMEVSMFRSLSRYVTGASRSYGRRSVAIEGGEQSGLLSKFDRNACQWRTVSRILHVMREGGFLSLSHCGSEWLSNVFTSPPLRMCNKAEQDDILNIASIGEITAQLHLSVLLPEVFGGLSEADRTYHFNGKKFKRWTKSRAVLRPAKSMSKEDGSAICSQGHAASVNGGSPLPNEIVKSGRGKAFFMKTLQDRRRQIQKMKDVLHGEERRALRCRNDVYLREVMDRWDQVHMNRHLISPYADCFLDLNRKFNHAAKSRFMKYAVRDNRDIIFPLNEMQRELHRNGQGATFGDVSRPLLAARIPPYSSIQLDVMNALHYRGDNAHRGTSLKDVVTGKMKNVLRPWILGPSARNLKQIHLHIDDPGLVIMQKRAEQRRRDELRNAASSRKEGGLEHVSEMGERYALGFDQELNIPWSTLLGDRGYKDELATLHLFCGAVAAFELLQESNSTSNCSIFLHGGAFAISKPPSIANSLQLLPCRSNCCENSDLQGMEGRVLLTPPGTKEFCSSDITPIPRSRCLIFNTQREFSVGNVELRHGESETRFVATTNEYILKDECTYEEDNAQPDGTESTFHEGSERSLIISDDTDVFLILISNPTIHGMGVLNVLNDSVHDVDEATRTLKALGTCGQV